MKILVVVHGFPPSAQGGAEVYAHAHARALRDCGDEILVFTRDQDPDRPDYDVRHEQHDGLHLVSVNNLFRHTRTFADTYTNETIGAIANRVIDDFGPDVAHIHHLTCLSTTIVNALAERGIPRFMTLHDYWLLCHRGQLLDVDARLCEGPGREGARGCGRCLGPVGGAGTIGFMGARALGALERRLPDGPGHGLRSAAAGFAKLAFSAEATADPESKRVAHMRNVCAEVTHFLAPSQHLRERFVQFGVPPGRITVARNGLDHAVFQSFHRREHAASSPLRLGFLGSLMVSKAPHLILEAVHRLPAGAVTVDFFGAVAAYHGDDSYGRQLVALARERGARVHGAIAHEAVADALASIDVLVVPSIWPENSPLVIQEAFLAGAPVVASRIGGIPEAVEHERNGLLFRAGDADDLARALLRLLREPGLLDALRAGIPPVRTIEEDVSSARRLYQEHLLGDASAPRLAAVVLNYRTPDDTLLAINSLLASRRAIEDIIVVDNDRSDAQTDLRQTLNGVWSRISFIQTGGNLGFSGGMNVGIRKALERGADQVLLVNSDVFVPPDSVEQLERGLGRVARAGIAGPMVLARSEPERIASLGMSYTRSSGRMRHLGVGGRAATGTPSGDRVVDGVSGCLMLVKRDVFDAVGLLDEDYFFSFEDLDFCLRAARAGFKTVLAPRSTVYHQGGQSIGASPRRLYFAARNHLLMAERTDPSAGWFARAARAASIVALNLAHAARSSGGPRPARLGAVLRGTRDYAARRFGIDSAPTAPPPVS